MYVKHASQKRTHSHSAMLYPRFRLFQDHLSFFNLYTHNYSQYLYMGNVGYMI